MRARAALAILALAACEPESSTPPEPVLAQTATEIAPESAPPEPAPEPPPAEVEADPPPPEPVDPLAALDADTAAAFRAGDEDEYQPWDVHYVKTNERRHDVWFPFIDDIGGAYIGVGADQNFTLIARAKSTYVFLIDIDARVGETHLVYEALIEASPTPAELLAHFEKANQAATIELLQAHYAALDERARKKLVRAYTASRETLRKHLAFVAKRTKNDAPTSWLSDPAAYDWVRRLFLADRVRVMPGDLTGPTSLKTIAAISKSIAAPIRVLYLSNAEEYFKYYKGDYRENVRGLPGDERSVVLRTLYGKKWTHADSLWNYQVQPLADFAERLGRTELRSRNPMIADADKAGAFERDAGAKGLSLLGGPKPVAAQGSTP